MGAGKGIFKSTMGYSFVIFLSRILGLFREILCAHILGGGLVMSAWSTAFLLHSTDSADFPHAQT